MEVIHKILDSGHHYVRAVGFNHLYAQWPRGLLLTRGDVSHGLGYMSDETINKFCEAAQQAADAATR